MVHAKHCQSLIHIMTKNPKTIDLKTPISEVGQIFGEGKFHHLPVVEGKELIGIVSYFDLIRVSFEQSFGVTDHEAIYAVLDQTLDINAIMTKNPVFITSTGTILEAAKSLSTGKFHSLPVVNDEHELIGIITSKDLIDYLITL